MNTLNAGMNEWVTMPIDNDFSFYSIPLLSDKTLMEKYIDIKYDVLYCFHGDRAVSSLRRLYNTKDGSYSYSVIVGVKEEEEVIFRLKYDNVKLLYAMPVGVKFDIFIESVCVAD